MIKLIFERIGWSTVGVFRDGMEWPVQWDIMFDLGYQFFNGVNSLHLMVIKSVYDLVPINFKCNQCNQPQINDACAAHAPSQFVKILMWLEDAGPICRWHHLLHIPRDILTTNYVNHFYRPQRSCEGYVFTRVCDSVHRGGVLSQHALQVVSQHALQQGGACSGGSAPGGLLGGSAGGVCSGGCLFQGCLLRGYLLQGVPVPGGPALGVGGFGDPPLKQTATVADGTHSCNDYKIAKMVKELLVNKLDVQTVKPNCKIFHLIF